MVGAASTSIERVAGNAMGRRNHIAPRTSAADLALPADVTDKPYVTQGLVSAVDGPFSVFHSSTTGFMSGVAARFDFQPIMTLFYQGSIFTGAANAKNYLLGSYHHLTDGNSMTPSDCSDTTGGPCEIIGYETT
jgi:hypothetical protein